MPPASPTPGNPQAVAYLRSVQTGVEDASRMFDPLVKGIRAATDDIAKLDKELKSGAFELASRQAAKFNAELAVLQKQARAVSLEVSQGKVSATLTLWGEKLQTVGKVGTYVFAGLTGIVGGFVRAGMQGTQEAQYMAQAWQLIYREVANLFAPIIQEVAVRLGKVAAWFRSLTGEQQALARQTILWVGGLSAGLTLLPRILSMASAITAVGRFAGIGRAAAGAAAPAAGVAGAAAGGMGAMGIAGLAAGGLFALLTASTEGREALASLAKAVAPILSAFGSFAKMIADVLGPIISMFANTVGAIIKWIVEQLAKLKNIAMDMVAPGMRQRLQAVIDQAPKTPKGRTELTAAGSGFEAVTDLYKRIAESGSKTELGEVKTNTAGIWGTLRDIFERLDGFGNRPAEGD